MGKLIPETSVVSFYRRNLTPADSLIVAEGLNPSPAIDLDTVNVAEGQWVTLDAAGKAIKVTNPTRLAFVVWVGGRRDAGAAKSITVLFGSYIAKSSVFDTTPTGGGAYVAGDLLTVRTAQLDRAAGGEPIVAILESPVVDVSSEFPDGFLKFNTQGVGGVA